MTDVNNAATRQEAVTPAGPTVGDAFGHLLGRCHAGGGRPGQVMEVMERDDGLLSIADACRYLTPLDGPEHELDRMVLGRAHGRVLDIGCGAGRHSLHLREQGGDVLGLDVSAGAVQVCVERGLDAVCGSVFDPPAGLGRFDTLLLMGNNLALLGSPRQAQLLLSALGRLARPDAIILGEGSTPTSEDPVHRDYLARTVAAGRAPGTVRTRVRDRNLATEWIDLFLLSPDRLRETVAGSGWQVTEVWQREARSTYLAELVWRPA